MAGRGPIRRGHRGYSLVELAVVLAVLGVLAAVALPRFFTTERFAALGHADAVRSALRLAQRAALASGCDTRARIGADGYDLWQRAESCDRGGFTRPLRRPGGERWGATVPPGVRSGALDLYFDARGRPHATADGALLRAPATLAIGDQRVVVEPVTGLVRR